MNQVLCGFFLILILSTNSLLAITETPHPPLKDNGSWIGTMEASVVTNRMPNAQDWLGPAGAARESSWLTWMGWIVASAFFLILLTLNLRMRRQRRTLVRGGEPDFFFLPPERNRRKRPR